MRRASRWIEGTAVVVVLAIGLVALEARSWLTSRIQSELAQRGFGDVRFTIGAIGPHGITFNHIQWGESHDFQLDSLTVGYKLIELFHGDVRSVHTDRLQFRHEDMTLEMPVVETEVKEGGYLITAPSGILHYGKTQIALGSMEVQLAPAANSALNGNWKIHNAVVTQAPVPLPEMEGKGTLGWDQNGFAADGTFKSAKNDYNADWEFHSSQQQSAFAINRAAMPWSGGRVSVGRTLIDLKSAQPIEIKPELQHVVLNEVLKDALGDKVQASGTVSGTVPVTISRDGKFTLGVGTLRADAPGELKLSPDTIPGDNQQVAQLRQLLQNFQYSEFSLALTNGKANQLVMVLSLQGHNPDVYNGRQVNLHVNLNGDVLDMLKRMMTTINDPAQLIGNKP